MDPRDEQAFTQLEMRYLAEKESTALIELYLSRLDVVDDTHEKTVLLQKIARVFDEELADQSQAFDALFVAFEIDCTNRDTVRHLERMATAANRWPELMHTVNGWLNVETNSQRTISLSLHMAKWYGEDLGHPEHAQSYYQRVISIDPENATMLRVMANYHKKNGAWMQQGQILTRALELAVDDTDRKEILTELGEVLEKNGGDMERSIAFYQRALQVDANHVPAKQGLERVRGRRK